MAQTFRQELVNHITTMLPIITKSSLILQDRILTAQLLKSPNDEFLSTYTHYIPNAPRSLPINHLSQPVHTRKLTYITQCILGDPFSLAIYIPLLPPRPIALLPLAERDIPPSDPAQERLPLVSRALQDPGPARTRDGRDVSPYLLVGGNGVVAFRTGRLARLKGVAVGERGEDTDVWGGGEAVGVDGVDPAAFYCGRLS